MLVSMLSIIIMINYTKTKTYTDPIDCLAYKPASAAHSSRLIPASKTCSTISPQRIRNCIREVVRLSREMEVDSDAG